MEILLKVNNTGYVKINNLQLPVDYLVVANSSPGGIVFNSVDTSAGSSGQLNVDSLKTFNSSYFENR